VLLPFAVLGFLIYSNIFYVPFHFDDAHVVSDLSFEQMLEKCKGGGSRVICHLTFLFNYWLDGTNVFGYHIFNTLVHIGTAYFVFVFLFQILSISHTKPEIYASSNQHTDSVLSPLSNPVFWPAFLGGFLFLVHPLATQAVTYITQRYASLAGFFYIGSLALFVSARIASQQNERFLKRSHLIPYLCSFVLAVLAMRTKEMAITLPAVVLLTEYYFIQSDFRTAGKRLLYLLPLLSTALIIPVSDMIGVETISLESVAALQDYTWGEGITRKEYLFTQFKIILGIYLKLLVWPTGQNIDHDYVVSKTLFDPPTMASLAALFVILGTGVWLFKRARLVSFGILWFFVTISPTSSIIPNTEFVAEHRAYIALMGLAFAAAGLPSWGSRWKRYVWVLVPALLLLAGLTYSRNNDWLTDLSLWKDSVAKSPKKSRPHYNLGVVLSDQGRLEEAISHYSEALRIKPDYANAHNNLGNALTKQGSLKEAISHYSKALHIKPDYDLAHINLGVALVKQGKLKEAVNHYSEALHIKPVFAEAHYNLGNAMAEQGSLKEAISHYSEALRIKPDYANAHNNLGNVLADQGRLEEAISHYSEALRIKPDYADAHNNLGVALAEQGRLGEAISHYSEALRIKPDYAEAHYNLGNCYDKKGWFDKAISHYQQAIQIDPNYVKAHYNLGLAYALKGKYDIAFKEMRLAKRLSSPEQWAEIVKGIKGDKASIADNQL
jgi:tetratricopeptide (TPR) repeat protein